MSGAWGSAIQENVKTIECPVDKAKAVKNETEIEGFRKAYLRDGAATVSRVCCAVQTQQLTKALCYRSGG